MSAREILIGLHVKNNGDWNKVYDDLRNKNYPDNLETDEVMDLVESDRVITILDEDYPDKFKHIYKPPFVIVV